MEIKSSPQSTIAKRTTSVTILVTGDIHGHVLHHSCHTHAGDHEEQNQGLCYPGAPYLSSAINTIRAKEPNVVLLDTGDAAFGSGGEFDETMLVAKTMNLLKYDAMALGNHELDIGAERLRQFVDLVEFPILASNVQGLPSSRGKDLSLASHITISLTHSLNNDTLCLIGVTANEPNPLTGADLEIGPEVDAVKAILTELTNSTCSRKIILSHAGIDVDRRLARETSNMGVDAILGGHSHVLIPTVDISPESPEFGTVLQEEEMNIRVKESETPVLLHTGANGRYLGILRLEWDNSSKNLVKVATEILPLDVDHGVQPDTSLMEWQAKWVEQHKTKTKRNKVDIPIEGDDTICSRPCRMGDCILGQIVTDAMSFCLERGPCIQGIVKKTKGTPAVALLESGTLRSCLHSKRQNFNEVLPWSNTLVLLQVKGSLIRQMLQHGISSKTGGGFLQVSGLQYSYLGEKLQNDVRLKQHYVTGQSPLRSQVESDAESNGVGSSEYPSQSELDDNSSHWVVVTDWLAAGGDGFGDLVEQATAIVKTNISLHDAISAYATSNQTAYKTSSQNCRSSHQHATTSFISLDTAARGALAGFLGGLIAFLITFPIYTLFVRKIMSKSLVCSWSLLKGVWIGALATAIMDGVYFMMYSWAVLSGLSRFEKSTVAAVSSCLVGTPLWTIVTQQQLLESNIPIWRMLRTNYKSRGLWGFFDSLPFNLLLCIQPIIRQASLEFLVESFELSSSTSIGSAASVASLAATIITYPIQKWRVLKQSGDKNSKLCIGCGLSRKFGIRVGCHVFYNGLGFKLLDTCLKNFVLFFIVEEINSILPAVRVVVSTA